jgi:DNA processing protein
MLVSYHGLAKLRASKHPRHSEVTRTTRSDAARPGYWKSHSSANNPQPVAVAGRRWFIVARYPQAIRGSQIPLGIADLPRPPQQLYLTGSIPTLAMIAVVGTRRPTPEAEEFAENLARGIVGHGLAVVSGGAAGIDSAAHRGALAAGGQTLVVAPAGWTNPFPQHNRQLFERIVERGGGYLSLVEPETPPLSGNFFARNAVLVALAKATVVVQAPMRSGARNAAYAARKLGRLLYVVPSAPWVESGVGCILELRLGARPLGCLGDLLAGLAEIGVLGSRDPLQLELPTANAKRNQTGAVCNGLALIKAIDIDVNQGSDLTPVVAALSRGCRSLDSVCQSSGLSTPKVQSALLHLTLIGCIRMTSAGQIELVST